MKRPVKIAIGVVAVLALLFAALLGAMALLFPPARVKAIVLEKAGADTTKATFFSPDQFVIDFAGGSTVGKMAAASKTLSTRFVKLEGLDGDDWTSISTADDVKELVGDIDWANDGVKKTTVSKDDIFAIKANDGSVGLIRITAVERPGEKKFQVNLQARLLK